MATMVPNYTTESLLTIPNFNASNNRSIPSHHSSYGNWHQELSRHLSSQDHPDDELEQHTVWAPAAIATMHARARTFCPSGQQCPAAGDGAEIERLKAELAGVRRENRGLKSKNAQLKERVGALSKRIGRHTDTRSTTTEDGSYASSAGSSTTNVTLVDTPMQSRNPSNVALNRTSHNITHSTDLDLLRLDAFRLKEATMHIGTELAFENHCKVRTAFLDGQRALEKAVVLSQSLIERNECLEAKSRADRQGIWEAQMESCDLVKRNESLERLLAEEREKVRKMEEMYGYEVAVARFAEMRVDGEGV